METVGSILKTKGSQVWSVEAGTTVYDALALLAEKGVGALLVVEAGRLAGMLSERDYARKVILEGRSSKETRVGDIMTRDVITVTPEHKVDECMRLMTEHHVRHLPVMRGTEIVGIVSIGDLVNSIISEQAHTIEQLSSYIGGTYPGA